MKRMALELVWALATGCMCTVIDARFGFNVALAFCLISAFAFAGYLVWREMRRKAEGK